MTTQTHLKFAVLFAIACSLLAGAAFLLGLFITIKFAPAPIADALNNLKFFFKVMMIGGLITGFVQAFLSIWLRNYSRKSVWPLNIAIAVLSGGLVSFFSLWVVWIFESIGNFLLSLLLMRLLERQALKAPISSENA